MQITIDKKTVDIELKKKDVRLKDVIDEVEDFLLSVGRIPVGLQFNGQEVSQKELDDSLSRTMDGEESLQFSSINVVEFVIQNIEGAMSANEGLKHKIQSFADEMHQKSKSVDVKQVSEELENFFVFWMRIYNLIPHDFDGHLFNKMPFKEFLDSFQKNLKEIVEAMTQGDFVLSADLLQYEIIPSVSHLEEGVPLLLKKMKEKLNLIQNPS